MERDVEKDCTPKYFIDTLRRLADGLEAGDKFRIQVAGQRMVIPTDAKLSIEHEAEDGTHELEFQLSWSEADSALREDTGLLFLSRVVHRVSDGAFNAEGQR